MLSSGISPVVTYEGTGVWTAVLAVPPVLSIVVLKSVVVVVVLVVVVAVVLVVVEIRRHRCVDCGLAVPPVLSIVVLKLVVVVLPSRLCICMFWGLGPRV